MESERQPSAGVVLSAESAGLRERKPCPSAAGGGEVLAKEWTLAMDPTAGTWTRGRPGNELETNS